jgi:hypothetical protein
MVLPFEGGESRQYERDGYAKVVCAAYMKCQMRVQGVFGRPDAADSRQAQDKLRISRLPRGSAFN